MAFGGKSIGTSTRVLTFALAVLLAVFLTQVATHIHQGGPSETNCQICQATHLSSTLPSGSVTLYVTSQSVGYVEFFVVAFDQDFFFHDSQSRAPPPLPS